MNADRKQGLKGLGLVVTGSGLLICPSWPPQQLGPSREQPLWTRVPETGSAARESPRLTTFAGSENYPAFSPDGNHVAISWNGEKQDNWDVYVKMIGTATALRLTADAADDLYPAWSPDRRQIAFLN